MTQQHHLNHATWDCKYHVVFIPKYREKAVFGKIKKNFGAVFHDLPGGGNAGSRKAISCPIMSICWSRSHRNTRSPR
jgi:hypothetical protein